MHVEVTRMIHAALTDPEIGVTPLLLKIPRKRIDGTTDLLPTLAAVYSDVDRPEGVTDPDWMKHINPPDRPALVIVADQDLTGEDLEDKFKPGREVSIGVAIAYYTDDVDRERAVVDGNYVLRAAKQSVIRMIHWPMSRRTLNDIRLTQIERIATQRVAGAAQGPSSLMGFLFVRINALDMAP